jgi:hypothetical protein
VVHVALLGRPGEFPVSRLRDEIAVPVQHGGIFSGKKHRRILALAENVPGTNVLFANRAANDAASSISGRVARVIILTSVDDDCSSAGMKD